MVNAEPLSTGLQRLLKMIESGNIRRRLVGGAARILLIILRRLVVSVRNVPVNFFD
jgi:hypothetical protein